MTGGHTPAEVGCLSTALLHMSISTSNHMSQTHLPSLRAFLGELSKVNGLLRVLLAVLLSTCLDKEGVRRRLPLRLVDVFTHHTGGLSGRQDRSQSVTAKCLICHLEQHTAVYYSY